jgi:RND family efflux transporter MFP subunit
MSSPKPSLDDLRIERTASAERKGQPWVWIVVLAALAIVAFVLWRSKGAKPVPVRTAIARDVGGTAPDRTVLNASGYVTARREATVSSKVTGKVTEVLVEEGLQVKEGQVLARLDDTNIKASLRLAEAQLESAKAAIAETQARLKEAEITLRRITDLSKQEVSTPAELDHAQAEAASLKAKLEQQQAEIKVADRQVAAWQQQLDDTIIRAPFSGMVTSKNAQPGEMISPMSAGGGFTRTGICTIVDMDSLEIEIDVNESYINRVQASQPVEATLDAYSDWKIPAKVIAIIPTADRQKSTVKVRVGFDKLDLRILPQMSVKVAFREAAASPTPGTRGVAVPNSAVQNQNGRATVLVVQNDRAEQRTVQVSSTGANEIIIAAGLTSGEKVILNPPSTLKSGSLVKQTD